MFRLAAEVFLVSALLVVARESAAQTPVHHYFVNDGLDNAHQPEFAEVAVDLGGLIPHSTYADAAHYYNSRWNAGAAGQSFQSAMRRGILDLAWLNTQIAAYAPGAAPIYPLDSSDWQLETTPSGPLLKNTWWSSGASTRRVFLWPYRVNGAPVTVAIREHPPGSGQLGHVAAPDLLFFQYHFHHSNFGVNQNRLLPGPWGPGEFETPEAGWSGPSGLPNLSPQEQALEAGDVVVFVTENQSDGLWVSLQRVQDAGWLVRGPFAIAPPNPAGGYFPAIAAFGRSFLDGGSWGCLMAYAMALLQPKLYAGSLGVVATSDISFGIRDKIELQTFYLASIGGLEYSQPTDSNYAQWYNLVDLLDMRFDRPGGGWDLAAFSMNRRTSAGAPSLQVPLQSFVGDEDHGINRHWQQRDVVANPLFRQTARRNAEHGMGWGLKDGFNEYAVYTGTEWASMKQQGATTAENVPLDPAAASPPTPPPAKVFPDPYAHTLRHDSSHGESTSGFLVEDDLAATTTPSFKVPGLPSGGTVKRIGSGIWPAYGDNMRVGDVDGDGKIEVVLGNLDGYVHVLQFDPGLDMNDPYKLYEEWQSGYLGRGIHAVAAVGGSNPNAWFANSLGQIWKMAKVAYNDYSMTLVASPASAAQYLYQGETPAVYVGDFVGSGSTTLNELLVVNRFLDWALFTANGAPISFSSGKGRLERGTRVVGPGRAAIVDVVTDDVRKELLVPAFDGHLWTLDPQNFSGSIWPNQLRPDPFLPFTNLSLFRVVPCHFGGSGSPPTHLLLFGRNDSRGDQNPPLSTNVIQLWDYATKTLLATADADPDGVNARFSGAMSFVWLDPPSAGANSASFVLGTGRKLQKFTLFVSPPMFSPGTTKPILTQVTDDHGRAMECITSMHTMTLAGAPGVPPQIVVAVSNGRIWVVDRGLDFMRDSSNEGVPAPPPGSGNAHSPVPWPSNRSLGHTFAVDFDRNPADGSAHLYFAEFAQPLYESTPPGGGPAPRERVGELVLAPGSPDWSSFSAAWVPWLADAKNAALTSISKNNNRSLLYRDLDGNGTREARVFCETGTAFLDGRVGLPVREFMTSVAFSPFLWTAGSQRSPHGGHVFETNIPAPTFYYYLGGFSVPRDGAIAYDDFRPGLDDWWYPVIGPKRLSGQIANYSQSSLGFQLGTSMKKVDLTKSLGGSPSPHVVVGTVGGFVYAIEPGIGSPVNTYQRTSNLSFASDDLGTHVIGMDAGELLTPDATDPDPEIVVGTLIDTGDYVDWSGGSLARNRGKLTILNPQPTVSGSNGTFTVLELDGDDLLGAGNGIGAGVTGVKIDDVNGDGTNEIWCGDAVGHLYLFKWDPANPAANKWRCIYRSKDLGLFPGCYNHLFPIKDSTTGKTEKLLVVSPGYVMLFDLDRSKLGL